MKMLSQRKEKPSIRVLRRNYSLLSSPPERQQQRAWIQLRSVFLVIASSPLNATSDRNSLKSHWSRRRRKHALLPKQWNSLFDEDGRLCDGGVKFLKKVRSGGVDSTLRAQVWPFLLGLYELNSSEEERDSIRMQKREEYNNFRKQCLQMSKHIGMSLLSKQTSGNNFREDSEVFRQVMDPPNLEVRDEEGIVSVPSEEHNGLATCIKFDSSSDEEVNDRGITGENASDIYSDSSNSVSFDKNTKDDEINLDSNNKEEPPSLESIDTPKSFHEDFATWQRIIRLDAIRSNTEWVIYSPSQSSVSETRARDLAESVGLKDYNHLEPHRIFHAARLVAILEAYTLHDPEIGYCQGMSDLLAPVISVIEDDSEAFWCFVGFMRKARHNFRLDEEGIRRQLGIVSKIIKCKDSHLYNHLEKLEAADCFFAYRMVLVLFRRELNLEQIFCLWEVIWADQASVRAGIGISVVGRTKFRPPPSEDLLLYAIAACVLQRRKLIVEKYNSLDEIMRGCNSMTGHLDVWKLLDDAHDSLVTLHDKI